MLLDVKDEDVLVERVKGRRLDPETGAVYNVKTNPPPTAEIADRLVQRGDDTADKIRHRNQEFKKHIDDIQVHYRDTLVRVDGVDAPYVVGNAIVTALQAHTKVMQHPLAMLLVIISIQ